MDAGMPSAAIWLIAIAAGILIVAALCTLIRIVRGPTALDRIVASDVLLSVLLGGLSMIGALWHTTSVLPVLLSLSLVAFLGAVAVGRYAARDRDGGWAADDRVDMSADGRPS